MHLKKKKSLLVMNHEYCYECFHKLCKYPNNNNNELPSLPSSVQESLRSVQRKRNTVSSCTIIYYNSS